MTPATPITVIETITHLALGGAQRVALNLATDLPAAGPFRTFLVTGPGEGMYDEARQKLNDRLILCPHLKREIDPLSDFKALCHLYRVYRHLRQTAPGPVVVHTHAPKAGVLGPVAALMAGITTRVHTLHGLPFDQSQPRRVRLALSAFAWMGQQAVTHTISVSNANAAVALRHRYTRPEHLTVIPPMTDEPGSAGRSVAALRQKLHLPPDRFLVVMVASLKHPKDPFSLVEAAALLRDQHSDFPYFFVFVGGGSQEEELKRRIAGHGLGEHTLLTGWRPDAGLFMDACDVAVLMSFGEGIPLVLAEALLRDKKVVATPVGGVPELVREPQDGFLVPPGDARALAQRLEELRRQHQPHELTRVSPDLRLAAYLPGQVVAAHGRLFEHLVSH